MVRNTFADLCVRDVHESMRFYVELFDLDLLVNHGWYAELGRDDRVMLALVERGHPTVPPSANATPPGGLLLSVEVDDAVARWSKAGDVVTPLTRELGQLHFIVRDPDGTIVDVIERVDLSWEDRRRLAAYRRSSC